MKVHELRTLGAGELSQKLKETQEEITRLRFQHAVVALPDPIQLRRLRREIARIKTVITEKSVV